MGRRKNNDPGRVRQLHPTRSFEQLVAEATQVKLGAFIEGQIAELGQNLLARQQQSLTSVMQRIIAIEEILLETVAGLTKDKLADRVATIQDRSEGFATVEDGLVAIGDRVRLEIKTKTADQAEFQGSSRFQLDNTGSGATLGAELETAVVGMKVGETKEISFGENKSLVASLNVHKVSRQIPTETAEESAATEAAIGDGSEGAAAPEASATSEETASASPDAG